MYIIFIRHELNMTQVKNEKQQIILTEAHHDFEKGLNVYAFFKVNNRAIGEDLVQDTFLKTWKYLLKGGKIDMMKAFLYHVLNNLIVDQYRKHKTVSLDIMIEKGFEPRVNESIDTNNFLDGKAIILLAENLPIRYSKIIKMRYVEDLSLDEIHNITKESKNTIAVKIHRGVKKLKLLYNSQKNKSH